MNRTLPPRDRGHRGFDSGWPSASEGAVLSAVGLVSRVAIDRTGNRADNEKARRGRNRAGGCWSGRDLICKAVNALAVLPLKSEILLMPPLPPQA
jgi:hypothetical protein